MLVGPTSSKTEIEEFAAIVAPGPDNYIAQPTLALSTARPSWRKAWRRVTSISGRSCCRAKITIVPGGLTRVALKEVRWWSIQQGGGTKDTWCWRRTTRPAGC